jgi:biotin carboxyl carrier protein
VSAGTELVTGTTICLLEVMKTFHRVAYTGERAKVTKVLVDEGADVNAGDALVALEPT